MRPKLDRHLDYWIWALLAALCYVLFFHELGGIGFMGPDEPRYAAVAREMHETGDYLTPRLYGENWFEKPVLLYWLAALSYAALGVSETAARLPSALLATASVFFIYWAGRRLYSRRVGVAAALVLATTTGFFSLARAASTDMPLTACLNAALALFLVGCHAPPSANRKYFYGFYAALGFGVLAKGPVAVVLPALAIAAYFAWRGVPGEWRRWRPEGVLLTALVAGPWYLAMTVRHGWEFIDGFLLRHNLQRFTTEVFGHEQPFYYYLPVLILILFPWTFLVIPASRRRLVKTEHLMLLWAVVPVVFFSLSGSKLPAYILPVVAPIALLFARELATGAATRGFRTAVFLLAGFWIAIGLAFAFYGDQINVSLPVSGGAILALTAVVALILVVIALWLSPPVFALFNALSIAVLVVLIASAVFPRAQSVESMRPWQDQLARFVTDDEEVFLYKPTPWMEYGLDYYRGRPAPVVLEEEGLRELTDEGDRILCIARGSALDELSTSEVLAVDVVHTEGEQSAFWVWQP